MFRDLKSRLGLTQAHLKDEERLARLLLGFQIAYLILALIGSHLPQRWQTYLASRDRLSYVQLGLWNPHPPTPACCLSRRVRRGGTLLFDSKKLEMYDMLSTWLTQSR